MKAYVAEYLVSQTENIISKVLSVTTEKQKSSLSVALNDFLKTQRNILIDQILYVRDENGVTHICSCSEDAAKILGLQVRTLGSYLSGDNGNIVLKQGSVKTFSRIPIDKIDAKKDNFYVRDNLGVVTVFENLDTMAKFIGMNAHTIYQYLQRDKGQGFTRTKKFVVSRQVIPAITARQAWFEKHGWDSDPDACPHDERGTTLASLKADRERMKRENEERWQNKN